MKTLLYLAIATLLITMGCNIEANTAASRDALNYWPSALAIPFIIIAFQAIKYLERYDRSN